MIGYFLMVQCILYNLHILINGFFFVINLGTCSFLDESKIIAMAIDQFVVRRGTSRPREAQGSEVLVEIGNLYRF